MFNSYGDTVQFPDSSKVRLANLRVRAVSLFLSVLSNCTFPNSTVTNGTYSAVDLEANASGSLIKEVSIVYLFAPGAAKFGVPVTRNRHAIDVEPEVEAHEEPVAEEQL